MNTIAAPALMYTAAAYLPEPLARAGTNGEAQRRRRRYRRALLLMKRTGIPFLGGGYALRHYVPDMVMPGLLRGLHQVRGRPATPLGGEAPEIFPFLGSSRLEEPLLRFR